MTNTYQFWTKHKARLQRFQAHHSEGRYNWLFLPGIGLGAEYLKELINILGVSGSFWLLDLPGDGSNLPSNDGVFSHWQEALIEAVSSLPNVILVAHSAGGMLALSVQELSSALKGLVLMGSAPDASWQEGFSEYVLQLSCKSVGCKAF